MAGMMAKRAARPHLDVITIGRSSVDLYGQQVGGRLEDMASFSKAVGGCPANIAIGTARLGLKSALISRVGDEPMGRFIRERLIREGVDVSGLRTDPERLTALVILGVRDEKTFPLIFYRDNCADAALDENDIDEDFIASAAAIVVTGTHFAKANSGAAQKKAVRLAKKHGRKVIFDVDYRPNLWGLAGHGAGEARYVKSDGVTAHLSAILPDCDLIVGTEEELHIAGGWEDTLEAIRAIRRVSKAVIVCKRGPMGCVVFPGVIPDDIEKGGQGPGFPVEVYNVLGAGDAFMSGFLRGFLRGGSVTTCCAFANACGAFAVSRLLCSPEIPTWDELQFFLKHGSPRRALRQDETINHIHWATTRRALPDRLLILSVDDTALESLADKLKAPRARISLFLALMVQAAAQAARGMPGFGILLGDTHGREALFRAAGHPLWTGRRAETQGSRPLDFERDGSTSLGVRLAEWPVGQTVVCRCVYSDADPADMRRRQERELRRAQDAARYFGKELMIELVTSAAGSAARVLKRLYSAGIKPDYWLLEAQGSARTWQAISAVIAKDDPFCRGVIVRGPGPDEAELPGRLVLAATQPMVKGFAGGEAVALQTARLWMAGAIDDAGAAAGISAELRRLADAWAAAAISKNKAGD